MPKPSIHLPTGAAFQAAETAPSASSFLLAARGHERLRRRNEAQDISQAARGRTSGALGHGVSGLRQDLRSASWNEWTSGARDSRCVGI